MTFKTKTYKKESIQVQISIFEGKSGNMEYHFLFSVTNPGLSYEKQLENIQEVYLHVTNEVTKGGIAVFRRYFLSDAANQADLVMKQECTNPFCALSVVQQAPLNGTKIAMWAYLQTDILTETLSSGMFCASHNGYRHLWNGGACNKASNSEFQTRLLLNDYVLQLTEQHCTLAADCIRTWFFVQNVDVNYAGVVKARKEVFFTQNLTEKTHYIASTGIEGRNSNPNVLVQMDAYSVDGLQEGQIKFLYAPTHLNPTYEYGVTFERGTAVTYGDRKQIFISGTASIDNQGEIVFPGNILKQTQRMLENIKVLLQEAGAGINDIMQAIVYLRDPADQEEVERYFRTYYPDLPHLTVLAPVCRPGWLIETECIAVIPEEAPQYASF